MAFSGSQTTRNAVGGSGQAYLGFAAKAETIGGPIIRRRTTRNAVGGSGRPYIELGRFASKEEYIPDKYYIEIDDGVSWLISTKQIIYRLN